METHESICIRLAIGIGTHLFFLPVPVFILMISITIGHVGLCAFNGFEEFLHHVFFQPVIGIYMQDIDTRGRFEPGQTGLGQAAIFFTNHLYPALRIPGQHPL